MADTYKLQVALVGDDRQLKATLDGVIKNITQIGKVAGAATRPIEQMATAAARLQGVRLAQGFEQDIKRLEQELQRAGAELTFFTEGFRRSGNNTRLFGADVDRAQRKVADLRASLQTARAGYDQLSQVLRGAGINIRQLATESDRLTQEQLDAADAASRLAEQERLAAAAAKELETRKRAEATVARRLTDELNSQVAARQKERAAVEAAARASASLADKKRQEAAEYVKGLKANYFQQRLLADVEATRKARAAIDELISSYQRLETQNKRLGSSMVPVAAQPRPAAGAAAAAAIGRSDIGTITALTAAARPAVKELDAMRRGFAEAGGAATKHSKAFNLMTGQVYGLVGAYVSLRGAWLALNDVFKQGTQLQVINASLKFAIGSSEGAAEAFSFLRKETDRLGISFDSAATQFAQLAAATRGTALEGQKTRDIFLGIAEGARAAGLANEQVEGTLRAVTQIASKGIVQYEELRGQLGDRLPAALRLAAQAMNVTQGELTSMIQAGKVSADEFLPAFANALRTDAAGALEEATKTGVASLARLENAFRRLQRAFAESGFMTAVIGTFEELTKSMNESEEAARKFGREFGSMLRDLIQALRDAAVWIKENWDLLKNLVAAFIAFKVVGGVINIFGKLKTAVIGAIAGTNALGKSIKFVGSGLSAFAGISGKAITAAAALSKIGLLGLFGGLTAITIKLVSHVAELASEYGSLTDELEEAAERTRQFYAEQQKVLDQSVLREGANTEDLQVAQERLVAGSNFRGPQGTAEQLKEQFSTARLAAYDRALADIEARLRAKILLQERDNDETVKYTKANRNLILEDLRNVAEALKQKKEIEAQTNKVIEGERKKALDSLQNQLAEARSWYNKYLDDLKNLQAEAQKFGDKIADIRADLNKKPKDLTAGTVLEPVGLIRQAKQARDEGDLVKARQLAELAADAVGKLAEDGKATKQYLNSLLDQISEVYGEAAGDQEALIRDQLAGFENLSAQILAQFGVLKNIPIGFDEENAIADATSIAQQIQQILSQIKVPSLKDLMGTEELKKTLEQMAPTPTVEEILPITTRAEGGLITGPGTPTSDNILARLSPGEWVMKAAAVKHYGAALMARLNSLSMPRFAMGGLVPPRLPAFAAGGPVGTPVNIYLPGGQSFGLTAQPSVAKQLASILSTEVLKRGRR